MMFVIVTCSLKHWSFKKNLEPVKCNQTTTLISNLSDADPNKAIEEKSIIWLCGVRDEAAKII